MRRISCCLGLLFATVLIASLLKPVSVSAITYGFVDTNNTYSNVGAFIVQSPSGANLSHLFRNADYSRCISDGEPLHTVLHECTRTAWLHGLREFR